ncbi:hypothetical protein [Nocardia sp. IFM 10818]
MDGRFAAGGSSGLAELIDKHGAALLADFRRYYGLDLTDVIDGRNGISPRKAWALIVHLPADSAFAAESRGGPKFRGWDEDRYLRAATVNAIRQLAWITVAAHSKRPPQKPEPIPTPDGDKRKKTKPGGFEAMLERARAAQQQRGK